jgi:hypothetical protein
MPLDGNGGGPDQSRWCWTLPGPFAEGVDGALRVVRRGGADIEAVGSATTGTMDGAEAVTETVGSGAGSEAMETGA